MNAGVVQSEQAVVVRDSEYIIYIYEIDDLTRV